MSRIYAAYSIGALVGPALGALGGVRAPFVAYAIIVLVCVLLAWMLPTPAGRPLSRDGMTLRSERFWIASVAIMFAVVATGMLDGVLPLHFASALSQSTDRSGLHSDRCADRRRVCAGGHCPT